MYLEVSSRGRSIFVFGSVIKGRSIHVFGSVIKG